MERVAGTPRIPQSISLDVASTYGNEPFPADATPADAVRIAVQNYASYRGHIMRQADMDAIITAMRGSDDAISAEDLKALEGLFGDAVKDGKLAEQRARAMFNQVVGEANRQVGAGTITATGNASSLSPLLDGIDRFGTAQHLDRLTQRAADLQEAARVGQLTQSALTDNRLETAELESIFAAATQDAGRLSVHDIRAIYNQAQIANEEGAIDDATLESINAAIDAELAARFGGEKGAGLDEKARALVDYATLKLLPDAPDVSTRQGAEALIAALVASRSEGDLRGGQVNVLWAELIRNGDVDSNEIANVAQALAAQRDAGVISDRGYDRAVRILDRRLNILANGNGDQGHFSVFGRDAGGNPVGPSDALEAQVTKAFENHEVSDTEWRRMMRLAARDGSITEAELTLILDAIDEDPEMSDAQKKQAQRVLGDIADIHREDPSYFWNGVSFTLSPEARAFLEDIGASDGQAANDSIWIETQSRPQQRITRRDGPRGSGEV